MKKGIAILLVLVMSVSVIASAMGSNETADLGPLNEQVGQQYQPNDMISGSDLDDPMVDYVRSLDMSRPPLNLDPRPEGTHHETGSHRTDMEMDYDAIFLYEDPINKDQWLPLPTREDIETGMADPVSFSNGTALEIHGKLFAMHPENKTYLDDNGVPMMPFEIAFDGTPLTLSPNHTGNSTTVIDPFVGTGNGTFQFVIDLNKSAGQYELVLKYYVKPPVEPRMLVLTYKTLFYVSHPTLVDWDVSPDPVTVGQAIDVSGKIADDTNRPITSVPLQIWFNNELLGPTADGVYIDDVRIGGTNLNWNFNDKALSGWSTYSVPGSASDNQWEIGSPINPVGPLTPHSGASLWGTKLGSNYQRGAWSFLVSPDMDFTLDRSYNFSFFAWWNVYWEEDFAYVLASSDGGATWDEDNATTFMGSTLSNPDWTFYDFDASQYQGSDEVRFAIVFYSVDKTLDVRTDGSFAYKYIVPLTTLAGSHRVRVVYQGGLLFTKVQVYEDIVVKQIAKFEFKLSSLDKRAYRNKVVQIQGSLVDSTGTAVRTNISGEIEVLIVQVYWDPTWTKADGKGVAVGPPTTVDEETGLVNVGYDVPLSQHLGPVNVTFVFPGSKYYTAVEQSDIYYAKAETYFLPPPTQNRTFFRGHSAEIYADLRIVIDQSLDKLEPGDPISGEFVKIFWNGDQIGNRRTDFRGEFGIDYWVPSTHELGVVNITFEYDGQSLFEPVTMSFNYSIVSEVFITFEDQIVLKGTWVWMNGSIIDDKGQGLSGARIGLSWKGGNEVVTATDSGAFSHQYYVDFMDKVGNVSVTARFGGNSIYLENSTSAVYSYKVLTLLERRDGTRSVIRGDTVQFNGKLYEEWDGSKGVEVQREIVTLLIDGIVVAYKRTAFDGSVTFTAPIEPDKFMYGEVNLTLTFKGTEFYGSSVNITPLVIKARSHLTFSEIRLEGVLFDPSTVDVHKGEDIFGLILLQDDNFQPIFHETLTVYYKKNDVRATKRLISSAQTDSQGYYEFNWTFVINYNGKISFIVEYLGHPMATSVTNDDMIILPVETELNITYISGPVDPPPEYKVDTDGDRLVEPGSNLSLLVVVKDPGDWDLEQINFSLVDPPEGMTITSGGVILWTPDEGDKGKHTITVRIEDGQRTEEAKIVISIANKSDAKENLTGFVLWLLAGVAIAIVVVLVLLGRKR
jgi:hypothetical protein